MPFLHILQQWPLSMSVAQRGVTRRTSGEVGGIEWKLLRPIHMAGEFVGKEELALW
jgi:hypothetical protein